MNLNSKDPDYRNFIRLFLRAVDGIDFDSGTGYSFGSDEDNLWWTATVDVDGITYHGPYMNFLNPSEPRMLSFVRTTDYAVYDQPRIIVELDREDSASLSDHIRNRYVEYRTFLDERSRRQTEEAERQRQEKAAAFLEELKSKF